MGRGRWSVICAFGSANTVRTHRSQRDVLSALASVADPSHARSSEGDGAS
jgi:hypothetical protein